MRRRGDGRRARPAVLAGVLLGSASVLLSVSLSGCTSGQHDLRPSSPPHVSASATPSASPSVTTSPTPQRTSNLGRILFDKVNRAVVAAHEHPLGADFTTALQKAGFPKKTMQLTADQTSIGLQPGSIQFSVRVGDTCFIGQYGTAVGGYRGLTARPLAGGACLIGDTVHVP